MNWGAGDGWLNGAHLAHVMNLEKGYHELSIKIKNEKSEKSEVLNFDTFCIRFSIDFCINLETILQICWLFVASNSPCIFG